MNCPRCNSSDTELMTRSAVAVAWEIHLCGQCFYGWRTSEPAAMLQYEHYDARFRLAPEQISQFAEMPTVPAAARKSRA
jgi:hypothetical protein